MLEAEPPVSAAVPRRAAHPDAVRARLAAVCLSHAVVDCFSALIVPILSVLEGRLDLTPAQGATLVGVGSLCSGLVQPIVAWHSDRFNTRVVGTIGFALAVIAIGSVGAARDYSDLMLIQVVGTAGIGAFHPVSAAAMGHLAGRRRSAGVAVFFTAGMVGGISGFWGAPAFVARFGVGAYAWLVPFGLACVLLLAWATHSVPHRHAAARALHGSLPAAERRARWLAVAVLYAGNVLRFTVNMAMIYLIVRWAEALVLAQSGAATLDEELRARASGINGPMQAAMAIGMGISGFAAGLVRTRHEKLALVIVPAACSAAVALFPRAESVMAYVLAAVAGVGYAGVIPITISLAQRLLPHRTSLASSLMMGGAWALAAAGPILAEALTARFGLVHAFDAVAVMLLAAGVLSLCLPGTLLREAGRTEHPGESGATVTR